MEYIFCDTMIFLHFKMFYEIDFCTILDVPKITLIVPEVVSDEIDKHKDNHSIKRIRTRASKISAKFYEFLVQTPNSEYCFDDSFKVKFCPYEPFDYDSYGLNQNKNDHQIIASIILFSKTIKEDDHITFITHDNSSSLTAKKHSIAFTRLPNELKLTDELSQEEQRIKQLESDLAIYKNSKPILQLHGIKSKSMNIEFTCEDLFSLKIPENILSLNSIMEDCPDFEEKITNTKSDDKFAILVNGIHKNTDLFKISKEEIQRYKTERLNYFSLFKKYLMEIKELSKKVLCRLELEIINIGNIPAESVDIHIHFPNGFEMALSKEDLPAIPQCPQKPQVPRTSIELSSAIMSRLPSLYNDHLNYKLPNYELPKSYTLKKGNSYDFKDNFQLIKHGKHISLKLIPMYLIFEDFSKIKNFKCEYIMNGNNMPEAIKGNLNFTFNLELNNDNK